MLQWLKRFFEQVEASKQKDLDNTEFDGYGFMRRVYGIDSMPQFDTVVKLSRTDTLTKAYNRLAFDSFIERELPVAERYKSPLSIAHIAADRVKPMNAKYGLLAVDDVLIDMAKIIQKTIRTADTLFRWNGPEFLVLMPHTDGEGAMIGAENIRQKVEKFTFNEIGHVTCSVGVTEFVPGDTVSTLLARADMGVHLAKVGGRNRSEFCSPEKMEEMTAQEATS